MSWSLKDIAGYEDEKRELEGIIDMFRNYEVYRNSGAYLSKGLIISGSPGVGKTLFARVLAEEIGAPFYCIDGADMDGVPGVREIKQVFAKAHETAPSVIFIDELNRLVGDYSYSTDYTNRNLSALLKLIDGINVDDGIFVIGATSDKEALDSALMRSGRMDKHVCLDSPDLSTRTAIFEHYLSRVKLPVDKIDRRRIAEKMAGFNGADIKTLVNETVLDCIHKGVDPTDEIFLLHVRKIFAQDIDRESDTRNESLIAYHDIGHLLVSKALLGRFDDITVEFESEATGNSSITSLFEDDEDDDDDYYDDDDEKEITIAQDSKKILLDKVAVLLGGAAAEEVMLSQRYLTSEDDLRAAVKLINKGFSSGLFGFEYVNLDTYYYVEVSQSLLEKMEAMRANILSEQYDRARKIVGAQKENAQKIYVALLKDKALNKERVNGILLGE